MVHSDDIRNGILTCREHNEKQWD